MDSHNYKNLGYTSFVPKIEEPYSESQHPPSGQTSFDSSPRFSSSNQPEESSSITKRSTKRGKGFSHADDLLIVDAWLNVSQDPIIGTDQAGSTFWGRVVEYYQRHKQPTAIERHLRSLQNRWNLISVGVNKFCGCMSYVQNRRISGISEQEEIEEAKKMYFSQNRNKSFIFQHCWVVLRNTPKWMDGLSKSKKSVHASGSTSYIHLNDDMEVYEVGSPHSIGQKAAKRKEKEVVITGGGEVNTKLEGMLQHLIDKSNSEKVAERREERERCRDMNERRLWVEEQKTKQSQYRIDEDLMRMSFAGLSPEQVEYYRLRQAECLARLSGGRN